MSDSQKQSAKPSSGHGYVFLGAALLAFIQAYALLSPVLLSFLLIVVITFAVNPLVARMKAMTGGRKVATALLALILLVVLGLMGWAFIKPLKSSFSNLSERLPEYWERLQAPLIQLEKQLTLTGGKAASSPAPAAPEPPKAEAQTNTSTHPAPNSAKESGVTGPNASSTLKGVASSLKAVAFNTAEMGVVLVTVFFGVTFTLMNPRPLVWAFFALVPAPRHAHAQVILQRITGFMPNWALATLLSMGTIGLLVFLLMWPLLGFSEALVLGLIAGTFEAVPYIGPILSTVPGLVFALSKGGMTPLWVLLGYLCIQALENNVIAPLIMARSMRLNPVAVIFSMLLCVAAFGVLGVLIAPPMVAAACILHEELYRKHFLPAVTDAELDRLARTALHERQTEGK